MNDNPKVTVVCITYNHERFIRQTLESFVMQKTNFSFDVIVGEDASTDGTRKIIEEFEAKYPHIIKPIYRNENIGGRLNFLDTLRSAKGQYIALCDGDDYFLDSKKLQIQADFLDANEDYALCFNQSKWFFDKAEEQESIYPDAKELSDCSTSTLLKRNFISTDSVMYRKQNYDQFPKLDYAPGDWYCHLYHARFGKIGFIEQVLSGYRRHSGGTWWDSYQNQNALILKQSTPLLRMQAELLKFFGNHPEYKKRIMVHVNFLFTRFATIENETGINLLEKSSRELPHEMQDFLNILIDQGEEIIKQEYRIRDLILELKEKKKYDLAIRIVRKLDHFSERFHLKKVLLLLMNGLRRLRH